MFLRCIQATHTIYTRRRLELSPPTPKYNVSLSPSKLNKRKKQQEEESGPSFSPFVSGPAEASVGLSAGVVLVPSEAKVELVSSR